MRSVVPSRDIVSSDIPSCVESPEVFTFYTTYGKELIEPEETEPYPSPSTAPRCEGNHSTLHHANSSKADLSDTSSRPRQLEAISPELPDSLYPLFSIVEEDKNAITLADERPAIGFPTSTCCNIVT